MVTPRRHRALVLAAFAALWALLLLSNQLDWDQFFSFFEVDRRSWLVDHVPPRWSYQLCAGSSRLGDPQAFGLSPLFVIVLAFGAFWGAKILAFACVLAGWWALRRILAVVAPSLDEELRSALALFWLLGDFFLWHLHAGHLTFALIPLSLVPLALTLSLHTGDFGWRHAIGLSISGAAILSAGFYPAVVFFLVPVIVCLVLPALVLGLVKWPRPAALLRLVVALAGALALSAHKWLGVLDYQRQFPRTLTPDRHVPERAVSVLEHLAYQLSPTWRHDFWLAPADWGPWDVWEYAAASAISICAVVLLVRWARDRGVSHVRPIVFFVLALVLATSFMLHEESALSLHHLLNRVLYGGSVRAIGRYGIVLQAGLLLFVAWRLSLDEASRAFARRVLLPVGWLVTAVNLASVLAVTDVSVTKAVMAVDRVTPAEMTVLRFVRPRSVERPHNVPYKTPSSYMYPSIARGEIVPNCYQPLRRPRTITTEGKAFGVEVRDDDSIDLIDGALGPVDAACRASVHVTQDRVHFDGPSCPSDLCLNLNAINLHVDEPLQLDAEREKYCRKR